MLQTKTKTFKGSDGNEIVLKVTQLPAMRSGKLFLKLTRLFGPAMAKMANDEEGREDFAGALQLLMENLTDAELDHLNSQLLGAAQAQVGGEFIGPVSERVDLVFGANAFEWFKALVFALEVNYQDFFGAISAAAKQAQAAGVSPRTSILTTLASKTSSGPSPG